MNPELRAIQQAVEQEQVLFAAGVRHGQELGYWFGYWAGRDALVAEQLAARPTVSELRVNLAHSEDQHAREHLALWKQSGGASQLRRTLASLDHEAVSA